MYSIYSQSVGHDLSYRGEVEQKSPDCLSLQDLQTPDVPPSQSAVFTRRGVRLLAVSAHLPLTLKWEDI